MKNNMVLSSTFFFVSFRLSTGLLECVYKMLVFVTLGQGHSIRPTFWRWSEFEQYWIRIRIQYCFQLRPQGRLLHHQCVMASLVRRGLVEV